MEKEEMYKLTDKDIDDLCAFMVVRFVLCMMTGQSPDRELFSKEAKEYLNKKNKE